MKIKISIFTILFSMMILFGNKNVQAVELSIGPKIGIGLGFYTGDDWYDFLDTWNNDNRTILSFSLGMIFDMNFIHKGNFGFGLQPEVLYTFTGGGYTIDDYTEDYFEEYYHTFQFPIFAKLRIGTPKGYFFLLVGPDILVSIDRRLTVSHEGGDGSYDGVRLVLDRKYIVGMSCGFGFDFSTRTGKLELGLTYSTYFKGFRHDETYNNMLHLNVAYAFTVIRGRGAKTDE